VNTMLVVMALVFIALSVLWYKTKNPGWVFPIALVLFVAANIAATIKGGVLTWTIGASFWLLIAACVVAFFLSRLWFVRFAFAAAIMAAIVLVVALLVTIPGNNSITPISEATTPTVNPTTTVNPTIKDQADKALLANGWKPGQYLLGESVDESKDKSTTGSGAFTQKGIKTPTEMVTFLKSSKSSANALLASIMDGSGATKEEVLSDSNWIAVQSLVPFRYPGNSMFVNGKVVNTGHRDGAAEDIFMLFISSSTGKVVAVRSACANPQAFIPTPTPPPSKNEAKDPSQDPFPRGNAPTGGGKNLDSGPGTYIPPTGMVHPPASPRVNPPAPKPTAPPAGSKPDPTPAPAPEPTAPTPDAPAIGYSPAPGTK